MFCMCQNCGCIVVMPVIMHGTVGMGCVIVGAPCVVDGAHLIMHVSSFVLISDIDFEFNLLLRLKILCALNIIFEICLICCI